MIDITVIKNNPDFIQQSAKNKNITIDVQKILNIDHLRGDVQQKLQKLQEERNAFTKTIKGKPTDEQITKGKELRKQIEESEKELTQIKQQLDTELLKIPNPAKADVKVGKDERENEVLRKYKEPTKFDFTPKDHQELGELLDIIDIKKATKVSGPRFYYLKNEGVLLEFALKQLAFELLMKEGFIPILPPVLIKKEIMEGLGYTEMGEDQNIFSIDKDDLFLVGTSEQSIVPLYKDETLNKSDLPKRYVGFSSCFRREAGSYGKDTRGIFRVHQFDKVEMVSFVQEGEDDKEHEYLLSIEEKLVQMLDIPYQVVRICTGDLGFNAARKYDIESWIPSQNKYREITSTSTVTDFQSRRLSMRYKDGNEKKYLSVLNGTAFSTRPIVAILENYQQKDGSVIIPKVLQKYLGKDKIEIKNKILK